MLSTSPSASSTETKKLPSALFAIWHKLAEINQFTFFAQTTQATGWEGEGVGCVHVIRESENILIFEEQGHFKNEMRFSNTFRWTLEENALAIEHLRFGKARPVFLFRLVASKQSLISECAHQCKEDAYSAEMALVGDELHLKWRVQGPKKDETIEYRYFARTL